MSDQISNEYLILDYIDDIEEALAQAKNHGMGDAIMEGIQTLHGEFVELGNMAETEEQFTAIKDKMGELAEDLVKTCQANDENGASKNLQQIMDRVKSLRISWS